MHLLKILSTILPILFFCSSLQAQDQRNMELFGKFDRGDRRYSGSWGYTDAETGKEYALLGTTSGTAIYDISTATIEELFFFSGPTSNWREITVVGNHAYIVTEGTGIGEGMQVIDLSSLPTAARLVITYDRNFRTGHIISRDIYSEDPFVYVSGTCSTCGVEIIDITDPDFPTLTASYRPGYYVHDCHVRGDYLYAAAFLEGTIDIVDISDKSNPQLIAQIETPGGNTHSCWTTEDASHLIISAEADGLPARIWNIEDIENLTEVATYTANSLSLTHNPYVRGEIAFFSHNTEGIRAVDVKDPALPLEVGYFDTFSGASGGFSGLWSAYPYFPSGKIIGGNREDGLHVWTFNNTKANRVYLTFIDENTGELVSDVTINTSSNTLVSEEDGSISWATLENEITLSITAEGYQELDTLLVLEAGEQLRQEIVLSPPLVSNVPIISDPESLKAFPNPFHNQLTIEWDTRIKATQLVLVNTLNQELNNFLLTTNSITISMPPLQSGLYRLLLKDEEGKILTSRAVMQQ